MILAILGIMIGCFVGAFTGLGGGIIIKLVLDATNLYDPASISVFMSIIVLGMTSSTIISQWIKKFEFDLDIATYISLGSILSGYLSNIIFNYIVKNVDPSLIKTTQSIGVLIIFTLIFIYNKNKNKLLSYKIKNKFIMFLIGMLLGLVSILLGIGGGPINIVVFVFLFSFTMKKSIFYTLITIFFSQITRLATMVIDKSLFNYELKLAIIFAIAGMVGGFIGTSINQKSSEETVENAHNYVLLAMIALMFYNMF